MGRSAGVRPNCSLNNGKNSRGKQLDGQAKSLTQRLVSEFWACQLFRVSCGSILTPDALRPRIRWTRRGRRLDAARVKLLFATETCRPESGGEGACPSPVPAHHRGLRRPSRAKPQRGCTADPGWPRWAAIRPLRPFLPNDLPTRNPEEPNLLSAGVTLYSGPTLCCHSPRWRAMPVR